MSARILVTLRTVAIVVVSVAVTSVTIHALQPDGSAGQSYGVLASVQPARYIVVDSNLQIIQIISNTRQDVIPYVVMNSLDGSQIPYTNAIQSEFANVKGSLSFTKAGVVYERNSSGSVRGALKNIWRAVRVFVFGS